MVSAETPVVMGGDGGKVHYLMDVSHRIHGIRIRYRQGPSWAYSWLWQNGRSIVSHVTSSLSCPLLTGWWAPASPMTGWGSLPTSSYVICTHHLGLAKPPGRLTHVRSNILCHELKQYQYSLQCWTLSLAPFSQLPHKFHILLKHPGFQNSSCKIHGRFTDLA